MLKDAWIFAIPAEWDALGTDDGEGGVIPFSYAWSQAVTGYWLPSGLYEVYNVQASDEAIDEIVNALTNVAERIQWDYQQTEEGDSPLPAADPNTILSVMKPHIIYDEQGNPISEEPATAENPNWGHVFFGQFEREFIFAKSGFSGDKDLPGLVIMKAGDLNGDRVGYRLNDAGEMAPTQGETALVTQFFSRPTHGGSIRLYAENTVTGLPLEQDIFTTIAFEGVVLNSADADYNGIRWRWDNVGVHFVVDQDYLITLTFP